jgi:hypothetical protein
VYINVITTGETSEESQYDALKCNIKKEERKNISSGHKKQRASVPLFSVELLDREDAIQ